MVSFARGISKEFAFGINVNVFSIALAQTRSSGFGADLGVFYEPIESLQLGGVIHNFLAPTFGMKYENENLLQDYTIGAAYLLKTGSVLTSFAVDMDKQQEAMPRIRAGMEITAFDSVSARGGYDESRFTLGAGLKLYGIAVDYAYIFNTDIGNLSRLAFSYSFGPGMQEQKEERLKNALKEVKVLVDEAVNRKTMAEAQKSYEKGVEFFDNGRYAASLKMAEQALGWNSSHAGAAALRKKLLTKLLGDNYRAAVLKYKQKDYLNALSGFMQVRQVDENYSNTANYINKITGNLKISGESGRIFTEGMDYFVNKDYNRAIQMWTKALTARPELKFLKDYIKKAGEIMARSGTGRELTARELDRVRELNYSGVNKYIKGDLEDAVSEWEKALDIDPGNIDVIKSMERAKEEIKELKKRGISR